MEKKLKKLLLPGFIIFIMVTSAIGFVYVSPLSSDDLDNKQKFDYNGFEFKQTLEQNFMATVNNQDFYFDYDPFDLELIEIPQFQITENKVYILFDPEEKDTNMNYAIQKLLYVLSSFSVRGVLACVKKENCPDIPIKDCNSTSFYFKKANSSSISLNNNCVVIEGTNIGISKNVDRINLRMLGIS